MSNIQILTSRGFKNFKGVIHQGAKQTITISTNESSIQCTLDHKLLSDNGRYIDAMFLKPGDVLYGGNIITSISENDIVNVYDALDVEDVHDYWSNGFISHNCNLLLCDEFAFLSSSLADEFIASVFPTLSSSEESKLVLISTPKGLNHFYKIWKEAEQHTNGFVAVTGSYKEIHDEQWAQDQLKILGQIRYNREVLCVSGDTLIDVYDSSIDSYYIISIEDLYNQNSYKELSVRTPHGYCPFTGIFKKQGNYVHIICEDAELKCSLDHRVMLSDGTFISAINLDVEDVLFGNKCINSIIYPNDIIDLYDIMNVDNEDSSYYTNGIVSHNCHFQGSAHNLVDASILQTIPSISPIKTSIHDSTDNKDTMRYFKESIKGHLYSIVVDVSRGRGRDYSAFIVYDISKTPYEVVCTFKNNKITALEYPVVINQVSRYYNDALIVIENNDLGESVANELWFTMENEGVIFTTKQEIKGKDTIGVKTTAGLKKRGQANIKEVIERNQLIINDSQILDELAVFVLNSKGTYEAQDTKINDDLCTCLWLFGWFIETDYFKQLTDTNVNQVMINQLKEDKMMEDVVPFGYFDDGTDTKYSAISNINNVIEERGFGGLNDEQREFINGF